MSRRVLMTADAVGGVWTYCLDLCRGLAGRDVEVLLAVMGPPPDEQQREQARALSNVTLAENDCRLEWMEDPWADVDRAGDWLLDLAHDWKPHLVHLNGYAHAALSWPVPVLVVAHSCVLTWWRAVKDEDAPLEWAEYRRRVTAGLQAADLVVAPTAALLDAMREVYGVLPRARIVYNGRNLPLQQQLREKQPVIFCAGRIWDEAKNIRALCEAAAGLPWPVRIAGAGKAVPAENTEFTGQLGAAELAEEYSRASIYCLPARYEPFGLSALEAASHGCALVLGDIPTLREVWEDAAVYVPPADGSQLHEVLRDLAGDEQARSRLAARGKCRAAAFTQEKMAHGYWKTYGELFSVPVRP